MPPDGPRSRGRDVTDPDIAEMTVALGHALDLLPYGVVACDSHARLQFANATVRAMLGNVRRGTPAHEWPATYGLGDASGRTYAETLDIPLVQALDSGRELTIEMTQRSGRDGVLLAARARRVEALPGRALGAIIVLVPQGRPTTPVVQQSDSMAIDSALGVAAIGLAGTIVEVGRDAGALVTRLRVHVAKHLADDLTLDGLASEFGYSPTHLTTLVRHESGVPAMELVRRMRLEEGMRLLEQTSLTVAAVAREVSPWDPGYFSRSFKRWTGLAPNEWRKGSRIPARPKEAGGRSH